MEEVTMLTRLSNIATYLATERDLNLAAQYIALNSCMSGKPCRFYLSRLNSDFTLYHLASFGYSEEFIARNKQFSLLTTPLLNTAIQSESVVIRVRDEQYFGEFSKLESSEGDQEWRTTVFLPLTPNYAATLTMQVEMEDNEDSRKYFYMLRSIINLYLQMLSEIDPIRQSTLNRPKESLIGKKLTERQELILQLIKDGLTNNAIATKMGYSESLIRQETMAIYQKLGIDGRRTLTKGSSLYESTDD